MPSLYELTQDVMYLQRMLEDGDIDEQTYKDSVESMCVDGKMENICKVIRNLEAQASAYKAEIDRMSARKKTLENSVQRLKDSMLTYLVATNEAKVQSDLFTVSVGKSKSVHVWDETLLPEEYLTFQPAKVNKAAISKALKEGEEVAGAELVENQFLSIR